MKDLDREDSFFFWLFPEESWWNDLPPGLSWIWPDFGVLSELTLEQASFFLGTCILASSAIVLFSSFSWNTECPCCDSSQCHACPCPTTPPRQNRKSVVDRSHRRNGKNASPCCSYSSSDSPNNIIPKNKRFSLGGQGQNCKLGGMRHSLGGFSSARTDTRKMKADMDYLCTRSGHKYRRSFH